MLLPFTLASKCYLMVNLCCGVRHEHGWSLTGGTRQRRAATQLFTIRVRAATPTLAELLVCSHTPWSGRAKERKSERAKERNSGDVGRGRATLPRVEASVPGPPRRVALQGGRFCRAGHQEILHDAGPHAPPVSRNQSGLCRNARPQSEWSVPQRQCRDARVRNTCRGGARI